MPLDQGGKGELGRLTASREPLQELAVGHVPDGPDVEKRSDRPEDWIPSPCNHEQAPQSSTILRPYSYNVGRAVESFQLF